MKKHYKLNGKVIGYKTYGAILMTQIEVDEYFSHTPEQIQEELIAHFKSLYLGVVQDKLTELDYDSLATVKLWEGDATFGAEATKILDWYKSIIAYNYALMTDVRDGIVEVPDDDTYISGIPAYV